MLALIFPLVALSVLGTLLVHHLTDWRAGTDPVWWGVLAATLLWVLSSFLLLRREPWAPRFVTLPGLSLERKHLYLNAILGVVGGAAVWLTFFPSRVSWPAMLSMFVVFGTSWVLWRAIPMIRGLEANQVHLRPLRYSGVLRLLSLVGLPVAVGGFLGRHVGLRAGVTAFLYLVLVSAWTFWLYARDKEIAVSSSKKEYSDKKKARMRIPERRLHFFSLLGGWPAAWLAQRMLGHKSAKTDFQLAFGGATLLNLLVLGGSVEFVNRGGVDQARTSIDSTLMQLRPAAPTRAPAKTTSPPRPRGAKAKKGEQNRGTR